MAKKDSDKLIRQLSMIAYLMSERRPVTGIEIHRNIEGYASMSEEAFSRRFYADRADLEAMGIPLKVSRFSESSDYETYALRPENLRLKPIDFTEEELIALHTALALLDGKFAYAQPLRLALQNLCWGSSNEFSEAKPNHVNLGSTASAGSRSISLRLAKLDSAIDRGKAVEFEYRSVARNEVERRVVDPYHLFYRNGEFYVIGRCHIRDAIRIFKLSRMTTNTAFETKAERDFVRPKDFDPRHYVDLADWQMGMRRGTAELLIDTDLAWQIERKFASYGTIEYLEEGGAILFKTHYADLRSLASWILRSGEHISIVGPVELQTEVDQRLDRIIKRHSDRPDTAVRRKPDSSYRGRREDSRERQIRPERIARVMTLAMILIHAARKKEKLTVSDLCEELQASESELIDDLNLLNVVNFGGGAYIVYTEVADNGTLIVDPEPYADLFARPAKLLPLEARALIAAVDLVGEHILQGKALVSARQKVVDALGLDTEACGFQVVAEGSGDSAVARTVSEAIRDQHIVQLEYFKANENEFGTRLVEPYALINGKEGWYLVAYDLDRKAVRHFRLDRIRSLEDTGKNFYRLRKAPMKAAERERWPTTGRLRNSELGRIWVAPERAAWARENYSVSEELSDGSVIVEVPFVGRSWLIREILADVGDAAVLDPVDIRNDVLAKAKELHEGALCRLTTSHAAP